VSTRPTQNGLLARRHIGATASEIYKVLRQTADKGTGHRPRALSSDAHLKKQKSRGTLFAKRVPDLLRGQVVAQLSGRDLGRWPRRNITLDGADPALRRSPPARPVPRKAASGGFEILWKLGLRATQRPASSCSQFAWYPSALGLYTGLKGEPETISRTRNMSGILGPRRTPHLSVRAASKLVMLVAGNLTSVGRFR